MPQPLLRDETAAVEVREGAPGFEPAADVIVNRLLLSNDEHPMEGLGLALTLDRLAPMLNPPTAVATALHKFATGVALADAGLPVPDALLALSADRLNNGRERFGDRAVYKTAIGTHGGGTWLVELGDPVDPQVVQRHAFLQEFLGHDADVHRDLRVYVVDGEVVAAMNRYAPEGEWRTNVALGGSVEDATASMPEEVEDIAVRAAEVVGLDYAGVDIVEGYDGFNVLEVNPTAGFRGLFEATGVSPAPYIAKAAIERAGGSVAPDAVANLATTLDDTRPACAPKPARKGPQEITDIGYIEEVVLHGSRGTETVLAKSDTGATRTSIDAELAARIGTGPISDVVTIKSGSVKSGRSRPVVDIVVGVGGNRHTVTASVEDRSHMDYPLLLGRDILEDYRIDVSRRVDADEGETEQ
jgi:RimK family alpha-L-glutamate ligase